MFTNTENLSTTNLFISFTYECKGLHAGEALFSFLKNKGAFTIPQKKAIFAL